MTDGDVEEGGGVVLRRVHVTDAQHTGIECNISTLPIALHFTLHLQL